MPGSITLPQVVLELEEEDRKALEALKPPTSMVVRYGYMRLIGEFPYDGDAKPGCGSKLVVRTPRGIELGEMLTSTCPNAGCGKSVSRKEMLEYIERSGGKDYPFTTNGKVLRVATVEDVNEQARMDAEKPAMIKFAKETIAQMNLPMKLVEVELLLGGDRIIFHYTAEQWVDFRELVRVLAGEMRTRIEMHQVQDRDEARLIADYEKCGQHCCCRQFLKVLKPVSMRSAKVQKATLDPQKISGRCGRLMCCLRYEDETYETLRKKLPHKQTAVETEDGIGVVIDSQILTQLVLVRFDKPGPPAAYPLENVRILTKEEAKAFEAERRERAAEQARLDAERQARMERRRGGGRSAGGPSEPRGHGGASEPRGQTGQGPPPRTSDAAVPPASRGYGNAARKEPPRRPQPGQPLDDLEVESAEGESMIDFDALDGGAGTPPPPDQTAPDAMSSDDAQGAGGGAGESGGGGGGESGGGRRRKRRRRRRGRGRGPDGPAVG